MKLHISHMLQSQTRNFYRAGSWFGLLVWAEQNMAEAFWGIGISVTLHHSSDITSSIQYNAPFILSLATLSPHILLDTLLHTHFSHSSHSSLDLLELEEYDP